MHKSILFPVILCALLVTVLSCAMTGEASSNPYLEKLLNAADDHEFNEALLIYGTLQTEDVPDAVSAATSWKARRRKNGAWMLKLCRQEACEPARLAVLRKTGDAKVWAILVERAGETDEKVFREKPELLKKALDSDDGETLAAGLRVALKIDRPGIREQLVKMLDSKDFKVLEVVLDNLSPAVAREQAPRLVRMLEDEKTYGDVEMRLALALVRAEDPQYDSNVRDFVARLKKRNADHHFFNEAFLSEDPQMVALLWRLARTKDGDALAGLRDQGYDALTRRVWAPAMHQPLSYELMEMTLAYLKQASPNTNPRAHLDDAHYGALSALYLIAFVNKGNTDSESFLYGRDAIAFTEKWLGENAKLKMQN